MAKKHRAQRRVVLRGLAAAAALPLAQANLVRARVRVGYAPSFYLPPYPLFTILLLFYSLSTPLHPKK